MPKCDRMMKNRLTESSVKYIPFGIIQNLVLYGLYADKLYHSPIRVQHRESITEMRKYGVLNDSGYSVRKRLLSGFFALFGL